LTATLAVEPRAGRARSGERRGRGLNVYVAVPPLFTGDHRLTTHANRLGQQEVIGGLGVSGDTACADHAIAYKIRGLLKLNHIPFGVGLNGTDNILYAPSGTPPTGFNTRTAAHPTLCRRTLQRLIGKYRIGFSSPRYSGGRECSFLRLDTVVGVLKMANTLSMGVSTVQCVKRASKAVTA